MAASSPLIHRSTSISTFPNHQPTITLISANIRSVLLTSLRLSLLAVLLIKIPACSYRPHEIETDSAVHSKTATQPAAAHNQVDKVDKTGKVDEVEKVDPFRAISRSIQGKFNYDWQLVDQPVPITPDALAKLPTPSGQWGVEQNNLVAQSGDANRTILLAPASYDPLRIELEVTLTSVTENRIGDITFLLNTTNDAKSFTAGYALTAGSYWNHCTTFYRQGKAVANTEYSPLKPDTRHRVTLEYAKGHIRYWLDDVILLEAWDTQPLAMDPTRWIGLRTWNTRMTIHSVKIYTATSRIKK